MTRLSSVLTSASTSTFRTRGRGVALAACLALLAACGTTTVAEPSRPAQAVQPQTSTPLEPFGAGGVDRFGRPILEERTQVALLLPLSGRGEEVGQSMLNAAQMALFDSGVDTLELMPRDTTETPQGAAAAARAAIGEGADLVIGPLFGDHVPAVRAVAQPANVNVISFSTDRSVAGGNVFLFGFLPADQVDRVVEYAVSQGMTSFAALVPSGAYGQAVANALQESAAQRGATARVEYFDPSNTDYSDAVRRVSQGGPVDALMLPVTGLPLRGIAPLMDYYGIDAQLLGTGLWDIPDIGREPALHGAWFASPQPDLRAGFEQRYRAAFGEPPERLATLAYDAVALAAELVRSAPRGQPKFDAATLQDPAGYVGIDGIFRFGPDNLAQRGLAVLEVTPTGPVVLAPGAQSFAGPAF